MRKPIYILSVYLAFVFIACISKPVFANDILGLSADAAILIDAKTGQVLYSKNPFKKRPSASTTKVMTALLAIEAGNLEDKVKVSKKAALTGGSSMYLRTGEEFSLFELLHGALMKSGNDACVAIAEHLAGDTGKFAVLMNMKALSLGCVNTKFNNPHGLPDNEHYSCAYDLALITRKALANNTFSQIVSTRSAKIERPSQDWDMKLKNTNKLLWRYIWADGVKTGTTNAAGQCLISSASKGNRQLIAVVLHSGDRWNESVRLFEYGFNRYEYHQVAVSGKEYGNYRVRNGQREFVPLIYASDLGLQIPIDKNASLIRKTNIDYYPEAPVKKGQVIGSINYYLDDTYLGNVQLVSNLDIERQSFIRELSREILVKFRSILRLILPF